MLFLLIIGITAKFSEITLDKLATSAENENIELLLSQSADNLINNLGTPNWEKYLLGTPGLAIQMKMKLLFQTVFLMINF